MKILIILFMSVGLYAGGISETRAIQTIAMLKDVYNIEIEKEDGRYISEKSYEFTTKDEAYKKRLSLSFFHISGEVHTNSFAKSKDYFRACNAMYMVFLGLDTSDKLKAEASLLSVLTQVAQGDDKNVKFDIQGVTINITKDSTGLVGCGFYK